MIFPSNLNEITFWPPIAFLNIRMSRITEENKRNEIVGSELWVNGLLCAFEYLDCESRSTPDGGYWVPIGWSRIAQLVEALQINAHHRTSQQLYEDKGAIQTGPVWWCHVDACHPHISEWLNNASWLYPEIRVALKDECRIVSERMKHLLYEVPVRVASGLMFELLGVSVGERVLDEDDVPVVIRAWQDQNFLITVLHPKGTTIRLNILGVIEVQELLFTGGNNIPRTIHEVIALLAYRLAQWDDRLVYLFNYFMFIYGVLKVFLTYRSYKNFVFGEPNEVELKLFINRRRNEDLDFFSLIIDEEIRRLSQQVIRVKWSLHAREEMVRELLRHLRGNTTKTLLEDIRKSTREMLQEQEVVRGRIYNVQDVMLNMKRAYLQDKSKRTTHNLAFFSGGGIVLSILTRIFGVNVQWMLLAKDTSYAFGLFVGIPAFIGIILIIVGFLYFGFQKPITERQVQKSKQELQELVREFHVKT